MPEEPGNQKTIPTFDIAYVEKVRADLLAKVADQELRTRIERDFDDVLKESDPHVQLTAIAWLQRTYPDYFADTTIG